MNERDFGPIFSFFLLFSTLALTGLSLQPNFDFIDLKSKEVDDKLLVHIETRDPLHHFKVSEVYACSSVDLQMKPYSIEKSLMTGCSTPGFIKKMIYIEAFSNSHRIFNKFKTTMSGRTLTIREMMVDPRSPVVYIEIHLKLTDQNGRLINGGNSFIYTTRYTSFVEPIAIKVSKNKELNVAIYSYVTSKWIYLLVSIVGSALICGVVVSYLIKLFKSRRRWKFKNIVSDLENNRSKEILNYVNWAKRSNWYTNK